jgi:hypothetical protein
VECRKELARVFGDEQRRRVGGISWMNKMDK